MIAPDHAPGSATSILMVEDEEHIRQLSAAVLERAGFHVIQACDAEEALDIWKRDQLSIDMLVADILVPGRTGAEIAVEFRKSQPTLKVIFISGSERKTLVETSQMVRGAKFLRKPFSAKMLVDLVRTELAVVEKVATAPAAAAVKVGR